MLRFLPLIVFIALAALLLFGLRKNDAPAPVMFHARDALPLHVDPLDDTPITPLAALRGTPVLLNFFASWCTPCLAEQPALDALKDKITLYGVAWNDTPQATRDWLKQHGNPYRYTAIDRQGRTGLDYGITGVPESFLISPEGRIVWHYAGPLSQAMIEEEILPKLKEWSSGK